MKNLILRVMTAAVLLPVVIYALFADKAMLISILFCVAYFSIFEITSMVWPENNWKKLFSLAIAISFYPFFLGSSFAIVFQLLFLFFLFFQTAILFSAKIEKHIFEKIAAIVFFSFYVLIGLSSVTLTYKIASNARSLVFIACACTWLNDTFAYFIGKKFGKRPLFLSVSAKKTWEGFFGGGILSVALVFLIVYVNNLSDNQFLDVSLTETLLLTLPITLLAPLGDLIESKFKRFYNVKDSSNILPGHGGFLDRIDGLLTVLPWTCLYSFVASYF